jgi:peroxiredoxin
MPHQITYHDEVLTLIDDAMEEGYMAQNIAVSTPNANKFTIQRSRENLNMTILFSVPNLDFKEEIIQIDNFLSQLQVPVCSYLILNKPWQRTQRLQKRLKTLEVAYDTYDEFGTWYGTRIIDGSLSDLLCKSLFLISRDGAVFYVDVPSNMSDEINLDRLHIALNKAFSIYTGAGCHG